MFVDFGWILIDIEWFLMDFGWILCLTIVAPENAIIALIKRVSHGINYQ